MLRSRILSQQQHELSIESFAQDSIVFSPWTRLFDISHPWEKEPGIAQTTFPVVSAVLDSRQQRSRRRVRQHTADGIMM